LRKQVHYLNTYIFCYSQLDLGVNASFKIYIKNYIKAQDWNSTNAQRAQYLVDILVKAAYDYLTLWGGRGCWSTTTARTYSMRRQTWFEQVMVQQVLL
jgi:hypothetical protein